MAADASTSRARTELNVAILYVDRAASRLAQPGHVRHALTLERLSRELAEVLAKLIAVDQPPRTTKQPPARTR
jgi:hypothetical protein